MAPSPDCAVQRVAPSALQAARKAATEVFRSEYDPTKVREDSMSDGPDHIRRWLINASGAAILSNAFAGGSSHAQGANAPAAKAAAEAEDAAGDQPISPITTTLCEYV